MAVASPHVVRVAAALAAAIAGLACAPMTAAQAAPVTEFSQGLPAGSAPDALTVGPDGNLWFVDQAAGQGAIGRITPTGQITEFAAGLLPGSQPHAIEPGGNGSLYFTDTGTTRAVGEITTGGAITETPAGTGGLNAGAVPYDMTEGPGGTLWFLDIGPTKAIGEISPTGTITEHTLSTDPNDTLNAIAEGPDGNVYFTIKGNHPGIGKVTVATGAVTRTATGILPNDLTAGSDGNLWFDDDNASTVSRFAVGTATVSDFGTMAGLQAGSQPDAMTAGPDGNVWFIDQLAGANRVGRITPMGAITEFPVIATPWGITPGIDGNLWFLVGGGVNDVARVTPQGTISYVHDGVGAGADFTESDVIQGPDGNLWAVDKGTPRAIVRADVQLPPTATTGAATAVTASSARIAGTSNPRGNAASIVVDYGRTPDLGTKISAGVLPNGDTSAPVSATLSGLRAGTAIFYRVEATNAYGTVFGTTQSFKTGGSPGAGTGTGHGTGKGSASRPSTTVVTFGNQRITIVTPSASACIARTGALRVTTRSVAIAPSKAAKLRFRRGVLLLDRGIRHVIHKQIKGRRRVVTHYTANATLRAVPATRSLRLSALKSGRHVLTAKLTYTHTVTRRAKRRTVSSTKTVRIRFRVC